MNTLRRFMGCLILVVSYTVHADELPTVIQNEEFDLQKCLTMTAEECISNVCITSERRDCQDNCRSLAQAQCKEKEQSQTAPSK